MKVKVSYVNLEKYKRTIVISDVHGDDAGFAGLLEKLQFSKEELL